MILENKLPATPSRVVLFFGLLSACCLSCYADAITIGGLEYSDVEIKLVSEVPGDLDTKTAFVPIGSSQNLETLATIAFSSPYPINHHLSTAFASAQLSGGVGASGIVYGQNVDMTAQILIQQTIRNVSSVPLPLDYYYSVLPLNVGLLAWDGISGLNSKVSVFSDVTRITGGNVGSAERVYDYSLRVSKPRNDGGSSAFDVERSSDLVNESGPESLIELHGLFEVHYDAFDGVRHLGPLDPGDSLVILLSALATVNSGGTPEVGVQALYGDPFVVTTDLNRLINVVPAATTAPEPSTMSLFGIAAVACIVGRRSRRRPFRRG